jgi:hypothetical protein
VGVKEKIESGRQVSRREVIRSSVLFELWIDLAVHG